MPGAGLKGVDQVFFLIEFIESFLLADICIKLAATSQLRRIDGIFLATKLSFFGEKHPDLFDQDFK